MRSEPTWKLLTSILGLMLVTGCTEKLPVDPIYTDDTQWTPSITLAQNNYQRIELGVERPPRKELLRNIFLYTVQVRTGRSSEYINIDTLVGTAIPPSYIYLGPSYYSFPYRSKPVLNYNSDYAVRFAIHYRTGVSRFSNEITFTTPVGRGKVLKRLPIPSKMPYESYWFGDFIVFHGGDLLILRDEQLLQVDTATGRATLLKKDFVPPGDYPNRTFRQLAIVGDTILTFYESWFSEDFTLVSLDLKSLQVDSTVRVSLPGKRLVQIVGHGSAVYTLWHDATTAFGRQQFAVLNRRTGKLLQILPEVPARLSYPYSIASDGNNLWASITSEYDNRITRFDPATLTIWEQHRNPIFSASGIAWDGTNFWILDRDTRTIAKIEPEGL